MIKISSPKILVIVENSTIPFYQATQLWLGPLYILSYLEKQGINGDFLDRNAEPTRAVDYAQYDFVCFSANVNNIKRSIATAKKIKILNPHVEIVFGGPFANAYSQFLMDEEYIDAVVVGEGEETFYEYITCSNKNDIKGLYFRKNGASHFTGPRPWVKDLDSLPFPALHKAKLKEYRGAFSRRWPLSFIITTRGCPYPCTFCFHNMGKKWRARSPKNVVDEMEWQINSFGVKEIGVVDDNFTLDRKRVIEICDEIIRRKLDISLQFSNGVRADFVDDEMMRKLKSAGLWIINFAPESGSEQTIERLKKGFKENDMKNAVHIAKKHGVATELLLMIGLPWETEEDYEKTLSLPYQLDVDFVTLNRYVPFPGTTLQAGQLSQVDKENLFSDRLYNDGAYNKQDAVSRRMRAFVRKWYSDPRRVIRALKALNIFSPNKLFNSAVMQNIIRQAWMSFR